MNRRASVFDWQRRIERHVAVIEDVSHVEDIVPNGRDRIRARFEFLS